MGIARKWVFPIIRILLVAAIAIALGKLAFFPDSSDESDPAVPTGQVTQPQYSVALGTITNDVTLDGTVSADPAVPVKAVAAGTVDEIFVSAGQPVAAGDELFDIKVETPRDPVESTGPDGSVTVSQPKPSVSYEKVLAPTNGVLSALSVIHGQAVAVGEDTAQVAPPTFSVSGSLSPEQQYRLVDQPTEASVAITGGPAPFTCTGLTISTPLAGADAGGSGGAGGASGGGGSAGATVRCAVPPEVKVFSGLAAEVTIAGGTAENVLVVPTTAVKGSADTGVVWFVGADGATEERPVTLGLNDGQNVEITGGVAEGDTVLQFVPGAVAPGGPDGQNCTPVGDGGMMCAPVAF
ncbi:efflux RND transporter periplasmic adaptor subunit [Compostimonas suwonensis]|uniref:Multidrug efflux pump subunit AcrA (Membrane-fusion protein) n=1 Tax=Compostimonas suwonensis TaxID=1048394 RepID=A0A2M9BTS4_9MICO|nr:efflux RND transporter periplasmic adaptor subunit [Compostimonas suwonensis]PJJ61347.1 multidrug efflux pump subunit AcrA (membrane-fusion protein) [Compostimonas suwonensis]